MPSSYLSKFELFHQQSKSLWITISIEDMPSIGRYKSIQNPYIVANLGKLSTIIASLHRHFEFIFVEVRRLMFIFHILEIKYKCLPINPEMF
jgi:hypothetical protein